MQNDMAYDDPGQSDHLTFETLVEYQDQRLSATAVAEVEEHLHACDRCVDDLEWIESTTKLMVSDRWVDSPVSLRLHVKQSFRVQRPQEQPGLSWTERLRSLMPQRSQLAVAATVVVTLLVIASVLLQTWVDRNQRMEAETDDILGQVEVQESGLQEWVAVAQDRVIQNGDQVRTGNESSLTLRFIDGTVTQLEPNTRLEVLESTVGTDGDRQVIVLRQDSGITHNRVQSLPTTDSRFEIRTPAAVISVRGTDFTVDVAEDGTTAVFVSEGVVHVTGQGTTVILAAGHDTLVEPGDRPATPNSPNSPDLRPTPTLRATPTSNGAVSEDELEGTPVPTPVVPTLTPVPSKESTQAADDDEGKKTPPGHTKTPEPPGQTNTPQPPGLTNTPKPSSSNSQDNVNKTTGRR